MVPSQWLTSMPSMIGPVGAGVGVGVGTGLPDGEGVGDGDGLTTGAENMLIGAYTFETPNICDTLVPLTETMPNQRLRSPLVATHEDRHWSPLTVSPDTTAASFGIDPTTASNVC